ncbi:MAG: fasciclin domain-containing protein [Bacteroidota bacterium]
MRKILFLFTILSAAALQAQTVVDVIVQSNDHETLETAVIAAELDDDLSGTGPFTVFAPTDDAFDNLPSGVLDALLMDPTGDLADILLYHVLDANVPSTNVTNGLITDPLNSANSLKFTVNGNGDVFVNQAMVTITDVPATNGVVHVIDAVVLPAETVVDVAIDNGFTTLTAAVVAAELLPALTNPFAEYTVFAPTDDAFDNLPAGTLDALLMDPTADLQDILLYHVIGSVVQSTDLSNGLLADPLNTANNLKITVTGNSEVFVNQAQVALPDVNADNGTVHVIDAVVLPSETVVDVAIDNGFSTLTTAVIEAELLPALTDPFAEFTVFAPTDDAFDALPAGTLDALLMDPTGDLQDILLYHVIGSEVASTDLSNGLIADPLNTANTLKVTVTGNSEVFVNQAQVALPDVGADNGLVHVIDAVVLPSETVVDVAIDNGFTVLTAAVTAAELIPALSDPFAEYTVFAPTDAAFGELPVALLNDLLSDPTGDLQDILLYHVIGSEVLAADVSNGLIADPLNNENTLKFTVTGMGEVFANQAQVALPDVGADNGVVHVIDAVVLPVETVADVAIDNGFTTLTTAVVEAELLPALTDPFAEFTVFAPTNDAFADLPDGTLDDLLADPTGDLQNILLYHVAGSEVFSTDLSNGQIIAMLNNDDVVISIDGPMVMVNDVTISLTDIDAENGVVHVIDHVILPATSILEFSDVQFTLFPNPTEGELRISEANTFEVISIYDSRGSLVFSETNYNQQTIDLSFLQAGIYTVQVQLNGQIGQTQLIKK